MSFARVRDLVLGKRAEVTAGLPRMTPEMRTLAEAMLARFESRADAERSLAEEGAAMALWGTERPDAFLEWHREHGGLAHAVEVLLAALSFDRVIYEWDSSVWALRRARPLQGLDNLGTPPWTWLRGELADAAPAERVAVGGVATSRTWAVRAAIAYAFPDEAAKWSDADDAELRYADSDESTHVLFGVLAAMRGAKLAIKPDVGRWNLANAVPPASIVKQLGARAVAPLRLLHAFDELGVLGGADAWRALAEFADETPRALAELRPSREVIAGLAPMFAGRAPRRTLGLRLARGLFDELLVAAPEAAASTGDPWIARELAGTGVALPLDVAWRSPWATPPAKSAKPVKSKPASSPAKTIAFTERIHAAPHVAVTEVGEHYLEVQRREREMMRSAKAGHRMFMSDIARLPDEPALRIWRAVPTDQWYAQADDVEDVVHKLGLAELEAVLAFVQYKPNTMAGLAAVESPRVAPIMARGFALLKKQHEIGKAWLDRFPEAAAIGLVAASGGDAKQRGANAKAIAHLANHHAAVVAHVTELAGVTPVLAPDVPALPKRRPTIPEIFDIARLPRPVREDGTAAVTGEALVELVQLIAATLPDNPLALDDVAAHYTDASLARFAWSLFRQWLFGGAPPKHKWALYAVGRFPDDECARALGRLARVWAPTGNPARAQEAVEALALMRTKAALVEIHDIAHKVQSNALRLRAEKVFATVAAAMSLQADDLADRLVPEIGEADLVFGDLRVELDSSLQLHLRDARGGAHRSPIGELVRWNELGRLCASVARHQLARLEIAMADEQRMSLVHFSEVYMMHSLIRYLARGVIWGAYVAGRLVRSFGLTADGVIDRDGTSLELVADADYGVVHPLELPAADRAAWAARVGPQALDQLERAVYPDPDFGTLRGRTVATRRLLGMQRRWQRGDAIQGGCYHTISRGTATWTAELAFAPGIYLGAPTQEPAQIIVALAITGTPSPIALSELYGDLTQVVTEGAS